MYSFFYYSEGGKHTHKPNYFPVHNGLSVTGDGASDSHSPDPASPMTCVPAIDLPTIKEATGNFSAIDLPTIKEVTGNFSDANKVVEGGFSVVYKVLIFSSTYELAFFTR